MRAIVQHRYGGPETLALGEVPEPRVRKPTDVIVRVRAASLNAADLHTMRGQPVVLRLFMGLAGPRPRVRGMDLAGVVEAVGPAVTRFRPGDAVFGTGKEGTFAELAIVPEARLARKPENASFEEAATLGIAAETALQGLRDHARLASGRRVLVYGAGGGVGTFAVQIAKAMGASVTAVTSGARVEIMRALGAQTVIDHAAEDALARPERYDVFFDLAGDRTIGECRSVTSPQGCVVLAGSGTRHGMGLLARPLAGVLARGKGPRVVVFVSEGRTEDTVALGKLVEEGKLRPVIERTYALAEAPEAMRRLAAGGVRGKLVLRVA